MIRWLRDFWAFRRDRAVKDLQSRLDEKDRLIAVLRAETEQLAEVIARDRARIAAEMAAYNRQQAEAEGSGNDRRTNASILNRLA